MCLLATALVALAAMDAQIGSGTLVGAIVDQAGGPARGAMATMTQKR